MRYLILSDIHSNWEALQAVLADAGGGFDHVLCCGDVVGYGADPNAVVDWVRANVWKIVRGNHDKACAGLEDLDWFNPIARHAAEWTMRVLTDENLGYIRGLPKGPLDVGPFQILHGSPLDEDEYLISPYAALGERPYMDANLGFFGHTHLQGGFMLHRLGVRPLEKPHRSEAALNIELDRDLMYLVNPGSVGQPRDGDPRAAYAIYDSDERLVTLKRIPYPIETAQAKIIDAGLPDLLAHRLSQGK